jgi:hypothetical protein
MLLKFHVVYGWNAVGKFKKKIAYFAVYYNVAVTNSLS